MKKMSNKFLLEYFEEHKRALELQLDVVNPLWSTYLIARKEYKEKTFNNKPASSLSNLYDDFNKLVNSLETDDLEQFILNTSTQDIIVFDQLMINEIKNLPKETSVSVKKFISNKINEFQVLVNDNYIYLPENVQHYVTESRFAYKENLYIHSKVSVEKFHKINNIYNRLVSSLDKDTKKHFVNTLMYQDFIAICNLHWKEFN